MGRPQKMVCGVTSLEELSDWDTPSLNSVMSGLEMHPLKDADPEFGTQITHVTTWQNTD